VWLAKCLKAFLKLFNFGCMDLFAAIVLYAARGFKANAEHVLYILFDKKIFVGGALAGTNQLFDNI
jgi:hypothetical protein